jgi:hypothetical protein
MLSGMIPTFELALPITFPPTASIIPKKEGDKLTTLSGLFFKTTFRFASSVTIKNALSSTVLF